jgi:hypothetical protein
MCRRGASGLECWSAGATSTPRCSCNAGSQAATQ